jgi:5-methylcytosine-specific restriction endonuclease McrA
MTRRNFSQKTKALIRERSGGVCEVDRIPPESRLVRYRALPGSCQRAGAEVDHIHPDWADGPRTVENGALLCKPCHSIKSVVDNKEAKKSNRILGKADRRATRGSSFKRPADWLSPLNSKSAAYQRKKEWSKK